MARNVISIIRWDSYPWCLNTNCYENIYICWSPISFHDTGDNLISLGSPDHAWEHGSSVLVGRPWAIIIDFTPKPRVCTCFLRMIDGVDVRGTKLPGGAKPNAFKACFFPVWRCNVPLAFDHSATAEECECVCCCGLVRAHLAATV